MDYLLAYRANSSTIETSSGSTALTLAFTLGNVNAVRLLLQYGGNPDITNRAGKTGRQLAGKNTEMLVCFH